ncbi:hypothetical protein RQP46_003074 [Phenoliferia psychrophenolica]
MSTALSLRAHAVPFQPAAAPAPAESEEAANARLIAQLLSQDLQAATAYHQAEQFQFALALSDSRPGSPTLPLRPLPDEEDDHLVALREQLDAQQLHLNVVTAEELSSVHARQVADAAAARQLDAQFQAAARRAALDREFAQAVQKADQDGWDSDAVGARGIEGVLGEARVRQLMAPPAQPQASASAPSQAPSPSVARPNRGPFNLPAHPSFLNVPIPAVEPTTPGQSTDPRLRIGANAKGKGPAIPAPAPAPRPVDSNLVQCRICFDPCRLTAHPFNAALAATSSDRVAFGLLCGPRETNHTYCIGCLAGYIQSKIEDMTRDKVFPISCPESTLEITDDVAARILGPDNLEGWHYRKLLDGSETLFCPNKRCSARVARGSDETNPQAQCPSCSKAMCVPCKSQWHTGYTCEAFKQLPPEARDPEDFGLLRLADNEGWRRCPGCKAVIELESGCYHITCSCGNHFCFLCVGPWNHETKRCAKNPPCVLWDEGNLVAVPHDRHANERRQARREAAHAENERDLPRARLLPPPQPAHDAVQAQIAQEIERQRRAIRLENERRQLNAMQYDEEDDRMRRQREEEDRQREEERARQLEWARQQQAQVGGAHHTSAMQKLAWMRTLSGSAHPFTADFLQRKCGYCDDRFNSIADLQQHLATTQRHRVFTCCHKFFRVQAHLGQHLDSRTTKHHALFET